MSVWPNFRSHFLTYVVQTHETHEARKAKEIDEKVTEMQMEIDLTKMEKLMKEMKSNALQVGDISCRGSVFHFTF